MQLVGIVATLVDVESVRVVVFTYQSLVMACAAGSLLGYAIDMQKEKALAQERAKYRERQLDILHVLHDSVANDLVYALSRGHALRKRIVEEDDIRDVEVIVGILEASLVSLRRQVIEPTKHDLDGGCGREHDARADVDGVPGENMVHMVNRDMLRVRQRLDRQGFSGVPQLNGNAAMLDDRVLRIVDLCVREFGGNMLKYGQPGEYALVVDVSIDGVATIFSSNRCLPDTTRTMPVLSSDSGLSLIGQELRNVDGDISYAVEDGEWSVYVVIPRTRENAFDGGAESQGGFHE